MACTTPDEIRQQIIENIRYWSPASVTKCELFIEAVQLYLMLSPAEQRDESTSLRFDLGQARRELDKAERWLAANSTSGQVGSRTRFLAVDDLRNDDY